MATGTLEIELLGAFVNTTMTSVASEPGEPSTTVFDIHDDVNVSADWSIPDPLSRMIAGTFEVTLYLEAQGDGEEFEIGLPAIAVNPALTAYHADILIPANRIVPPAGKTNVPYKLTTTVIYKDVLGTPGPIAGFVELPLVQFYLDV